MHSRKRVVLNLYKFMHTEALQEKRGNGLLKCVKLIKTCHRRADAKRVHARVLGNEEAWAHSTVLLSNLLIEMYGRVGAPGKALQIYEELGPKRNRFTLAVMIKALSLNGEGAAAKELFDESAEDHKDAVSITSMITSLASTGHYTDARRVFDSMDDRNAISWTAMLTTYVRQGDLEKSWEVFMEMPIRNVVSWTAIISAFTQNGHLQAANEVFAKMPAQDTFSSSGILRANAVCGNFEECIAVYDSMEEHDPNSDNIMLKALGSCGLLQRAEEIFLKMQCREPAAWLAMLRSYSQSGMLEKAAALFEKIPSRHANAWNWMLAAFTYAGQWVNAHHIVEQIPEWSITTWNALLIGYASHGELSEAKTVFKSMPTKNVVSWTALMAAYAQCGKMVRTLRTMQLMQLEGARPNATSFLCFLLSCAHVQSIKGARSCLFWMQMHYELQPSLDHFCCLVELLGRAGRLSDAQELLENMPFVPPASAWKSFSDACRKRDDVSRADRAMERGADDDSDSKCDKQQCALRLQIESVHAKLARSCFS